MFIPTHNRALDLAMEYLQVDTEKKLDKWLAGTFKNLFGLSSSDVVLLWLDLCLLDTMTIRSKSEKGFKRFLITLFFLWTYPKNSKITATSFKVCESSCRGEPLWKWIKLIASLK